MALVRIPPVYDGAGNQVSARVDVRLVDAAGKPVLAFAATEGATEYQSTPIPDDDQDGLTLPLAPTAMLARPGGGATWYQVIVTTRHRVEGYLIQVADSPDVQELASLVGASAIDPADIAAGRLLPMPAGLPDGRWVTTADGAWITTDAPPGSGIPDAPLTGGPYERQAGAWIAATAGGVSDHGALTGLSDDDHTQYHTDARGDARYSALAHAHAGIYEPVQTAATKVEMEAGTESAIRSMSPLRVAQAIAALGGASPPMYVLDELPASPVDGTLYFIVPGFTPTALGTVLVEVVNAWPVTPQQNTLYFLAPTLP